VVISRILTRKTRLTDTIHTVNMKLYKLGMQIY